MLFDPKYGLKRSLLHVEYPIFDHFIVFYKKEKKP